MRKNIFRYPGGKFKAIKYIEPFWKKISHDEYREAFVGGGSVFMSKDNVEINWINDLDTDLMAFYKTIKNKKKRNELIEELININITRKNYEKYYFSKPTKNLDRAVRYYVLNRCSFSGITKWNAYIGSPRWNIKRNTDAIHFVGDKLQKTRITTLDFEEVINEKSSKDTFLFLDPPYAESRQVAAYNFVFEKHDHIRLNKCLKTTKFKFLLTYDDCDFIRNLYDGLFLYDKTWTYSVANSNVHHNPREKGNELFISNFKLEDAC